MQNLTYPTFLSSISSGITVVDFYATWCGPCNMIAPYIEQMAEQLKGKVDFYKVNVEEERLLTMEQGITGMPTFKVFHNGKEVKKIVGADIQTLSQTIQSLIP